MWASAHHGLGHGRHLDNRARAAGGRSSEGHGLARRRAAAPALAGPDKAWEPPDRRSAQVADRSRPAPPAPTRLRVPPWERCSVRHPGRCSRLCRRAGQRTPPLREGVGRLGDGARWCDRQEVLGAGKRRRAASLPPAQHDVAAVRDAAGRRGSVVELAGAADPRRCSPRQSWRPSRLRRSRSRRVSGRWR